MPIGRIGRTGDTPRCLVETLCRRALVLPVRLEFGHGARREHLTVPFAASPGTGPRPL